MKKVIDLDGNQYEIPDELLKGNEVSEAVLLADDGKVYKMAKAKLPSHLVAETTSGGETRKLVFVRKLTPDTPPEEQPRDICDTVEDIITWCSTGGV